VLVLELLDEVPQDECGDARVPAVEEGMPVLDEVPGERLEAQLDRGRVRERELGGLVAIQVVVRAIDLVAGRLELRVLPEQEVGLNQKGMSSGNSKRSFRTFITAASGTRTAARSPRSSGARQR
jgi:hypothetical protein